MAFAPRSARIPVTVIIALCALVGLGALGAQLGGAPWKRAAVRVVAFSSLAMALTYAIGTLAGPSV